MIIPEARFRTMRFYRCPLPILGDPLCPDPAPTGWFDRVMRAARWRREGGALSEIEPGHLGNLVEAIQVVFREVDRVARRRAERAGR